MVRDKNRCLLFVVLYGAGLLAKDFANFVDSERDNVARDRNRRLHILSLVAEIYLVFGIYILLRDDQIFYRRL